MFMRLPRTILGCVRASIPVRRGRRLVRRGCGIRGFLNRANERLSGKPVVGNFVGFGSFSTKVSSEDCRQRLGSAFLGRRLLSHLAGCLFIFSAARRGLPPYLGQRSEEHTSELQSRFGISY